MHLFTRSLVWRSLDEPGLEYFTLKERQNGWKLEGIVIRRLKGISLSASYEILCDDRWRTRRVKVSAQRRGKRRSLDLRVDVHQNWWRGTKKLTVLDGCYDVDLTISPSTNTLPIRRLKLGVGEKGDIVAVWVRFPDLSIESLPQRYTHLEERKYRYEIRSGAFSVNLEVDEYGLVRDYPRFWEREGVVD